MGALSVAAYKKSPKNLISQLFFSTRAGFCLSPLSGRLGPLWGKPLFSKSPEDGQRFPQSRRLAFLPAGRVSGFTFVSIFRRISAILKLSAFLRLSCGILRMALCSCGIEAPFIKRRRLKDSSKTAAGFMHTLFPDMLPNLIPMSSYGRI